MKKKKTVEVSLVMFIMIILVCIMLAPIFVFELLTQNLVDGVTENISETYSEELSEQMSYHILTAFEHYFEEMDIIRDALPLIDSFDGNELDGFVSRVQKNKRISRLVFSDGEGFDGRRCVIFGARYEEPVNVGGREIAASVFTVANDMLSEEISLNNNRSGGFTSIIHRDGSYVVKNSAVPYEGDNAYEILNKNGKASDDKILSVKNAVNSGESYMLSVADGGEVSVYIYFAPIKGTDWYAVNTLPGEFIRDRIEVMQKRVAEVSLAVVAIFLIVAAAVIFSQVNASKKLSKSRADLADALDAAETASASKTSFLFNMSHDIRTPMNAILGYTEIGLNHIDDREKTSDSLKKIKAAGGHLLSLINDILEMSRIESGKLTLIDSPLDVRQAVETVDTMSRTLAIPKSIDFVTEMRGIEDPYIYADELHINEIIINLISNAVKYTPVGGKVRYTVEQLGKAENGVARYRFEIADTGIGMSEEFQTHLFEAFSREESTTVSKIEGAGLGLSIVRKIVDIANGTVTAKSKLGEGSTFTVELPFKVMDAAAIAEFTDKPTCDSEDKSDTSLKGSRILLVEDNEINREIATMMLEDTGLEVDSAEDGKLAVDRIAEKGTDYYDFVLMDIQMPVMDGYTATGEIRKMEGGRDVKIIALSANAFEEDKQKSVSLGMNAHIAKPIDLDALLETMHRLL